jgi:anti-sigma factor RsiW
MTNSCDQTQYLEAYLDGELPDADRQRVEQHLAICAACTRELARLRRLSAAFAGYRPTLSADALDRLHDAVANTWDLGVIRLARRISAVAAAVVLAGSLYLTFFQAEQATAVPVWEQTAITGVSTPQQQDAQLASAPGNVEQAQLAEWIVSDLGGGNASR